MQPALNGIGTRWRRIGGISGAEYVVRLVRASGRNATKSHGLKRRTGARAAAAEPLEERTYLSNPPPTKLVFISQTPIIVIPNAIIDTERNVDLTANNPYPTNRGVLLQLQDATNTARPPADSGEQNVTVTLTSTTVANPVFADGSSTETAPVDNTVQLESDLFSRPEDFHSGEIYP